MICYLKIISLYNFCCCKVIQENFIKYEYIIFFILNVKCEK